MNRAAWRLPMMRSVPWLLPLLAALSGGCNFQTSNSFSGDATLYSSSNTGDRFGAAQAVFRKNCASCHSNFPAYSEADWVSNGYVTAGSPQSSSIFGRIRGSGVGGAEDMPQSGTISAEDVATVRAWIQNMGSTVTLPQASAAQRTQNAMSVIATNCKSCHVASSTASTAHGTSAFAGMTVPKFGDFTTDQQFVSAGLVVPSDSASSWLIRSLKNFNYDIACMPPNPYQAITNTEKSQLEQWVNGIGQP